MWWLKHTDVSTPLLGIVRKYYILFKLLASTLLDTKNIALPQWGFVFKIRLTSQSGGVPCWNISIISRPVGHRAMGNVHTQSTPNSFPSRGAVGGGLKVNLILLQYAYHVVRIVGNKSNKLSPWHWEELKLLLYHSFFFLSFSIAFFSFFIFIVTMNDGYSQSKNYHNAY